MNKLLVLISHGLHQIQRTFFPDLEHEAGPIPETLVELSYILQTIHSQSVFSRVFAKFSETKLPQQIHEALIKRSCSGTIPGHLSRDATAIEAREKPAKKQTMPRVC